MLVLLLSGLTQYAVAAEQDSLYRPTEANLASRQEFQQMKLGIFVHWGIYSVYGQGEWYLQVSGMLDSEYRKAASAFYPWRFDAEEWVRTFRDAGAQYVTFTSRHHDGFSMWKTAQSDYNIVDATPYGKDVVRQLADACAKDSMRLHLYYSHLDWHREDYPWGTYSGHKTGRDSTKADWQSYYSFMNAQLTELLTQYGPIGAIWFDGIWDHEGDSVPFDWHLREQYDMIHRLQPACLVVNNHHKDVLYGEDVQTFERDVPGESAGGFSRAETTVSCLPLETSETLNWSWGFNVEDIHYKPLDQLVYLLVRTAGKGANLLLNVGPQPDGTLPDRAKERLHELGEWMRQYGESIYGTTAGPIRGEWGVSTQKGNDVFVHILKSEAAPSAFDVPFKVKAAYVWDGHDQQKVALKRTKTGSVLTLPEAPKGIDYIIHLQK